LGNSTPKFRHVSSQLFVRFLVEPEYHFLPADQHRPSDEVRLFDHHVDGFSLRLRQRTAFEDRAAGADEIQEPVLVDVALQKRAIRRCPVDIPLLDVNLVLLQKTSGVTACGSRGFPVEDWLRHELILRQQLPDYPCAGFESAVV
jgi:hypothetical protein